jgi:hypothetical protein
LPHCFFNMVQREQNLDVRHGLIIRLL